MAVQNNEWVEREWKSGRDGARRLIDRLRCYEANLQAAPETEPRWTEGVQALIRARCAAEAVLAALEAAGRPAIADQPGIALRKGT